jgi:hypothetical protein
MPITKATSAETTIAASVPTNIGSFAWLIRLPAVNAPTPNRPACPSEIWPAYPSSRLRLIAAIAAAAARSNSSQLCCWISRGIACEVSGGSTQSSSRAVA